MAKIVDINPASGLMTISSDSQITLLNADGSKITNANSVSAGSKISIVNYIKNLQRVSQSYTYILEVLNSEGVVIELQQVQIGSLEQGQSSKITAEWTGPQQEGEYSFKIFVVDDLTQKAPLLLKNAISTHVEVS